MRGSCLCREVEYEIERLDSSPRHCSCSMCRKAHAAAFNTSATALRVATLDDDPGQRPESHLWASREVPWSAYGTDVVSFPELEPRSGQTRA